MAARAELRILNDQQEVAREAADLFVWVAEQAIMAGRPFRVALSGGSTPQHLYRALAAGTSSRRLNWSEVECYFGDERCVPPSHPESNYRMAQASLFEPLNISSTRIFRMPGEAENHDTAARRYESVMHEHIPTASEGWPQLDLVLLGLGEDGHTASLFPGAAALGESTRAVVATKAPKGVVDRLTVTVPLINHAGMVVFLVTGAAKAGAVRAVLDDTRADASRYPAKLIRPVGGRMVWLLDKTAAAELTLARQQVIPEED